MTTSEALGATTSSFKSTYTLPDGAVTPSSDSRVLPPLSILSDRSLRPTRQVDAIAEQVEKAGFNVGWHEERGIFAVSPVGRRGTHELTSDQTLFPQASGRFKAQSFLTFAPKGSRAQRPQTSGGMVTHSVDLAPGQLVRPSTGTPRFKRFAGVSRSAEFSVEHPVCQTPLATLNAAIASRHRNIPGGNLHALTERRYNGGGPALDTSVVRQALGSQLDVTAATAPMEADGANGAEVGASAAGGGGEGWQEAAAGPASQTQLQLQGPSSPMHGHRLQTPSIQNMSLNTRGEAGAGDGKVAPFKRTMRTHPMTGFKPSRAQALIVFNHLDHDKNGKVTTSELEEVCVALGFTAQQARRLFEKLDTQKRGFLTSVDWGCLDFNSVIEMFSLLYMRKYMGLPDTSATDDDVRKYLRAQEVRQCKSLTAAINLVRVNAVSRGARASNNATGNVIFEAFRFLDTDKSGYLTRSELKDGFSILGVQLADNVADEVMDLFDGNRSGKIEYYEFVKTLFPKSMR